MIRSIFQGTSTVDLVDVAGTQISVESFAEERHAPGTAVRIAPTAGAVFALLDD